MKKCRIRIFALAAAVLFASCNSVKSVDTAKSGTKGREAVAKGKQAETVSLTHSVITKGEAGTDEVTLNFAATSDVHGRIYPYDYAVTEEDPDAGFSKIYTVIKE